MAQGTEAATGGGAIGSELVGRGTREGATLFREWFSGLSEIAESGRGAAYVFVMGNLIEILRSFDLPVVFPEINALQTAIRRVSGEFLDEAEDYGFSPDICAYVKADVAIHLRGGAHPMVKVPKPSLAVLTNACNTYIKWAEIWERMFEVPCMVVDIPGTRAAGCQSAPGDADFANEMAYIKSQVKELIETCERVTGKKFDIDRLRQNMGYANRITRAWRKVLDYNMSRPAVFNALTDGTVYLGVSNCLGGSEEGALYFERLEEEMAYRVANGIGATRNMDGTEELAEQRFRLAFIGVPCYPIFKNFNEMFTKWGGVFVNSAYLTFASGGADMGFEYDLANPIDSLAEGLLRRIRETMDQLFFGCPDIETQASRFGLDGIVYHPIKSCRTISAGLADRRHHMAEDLGLATLYFESDMVDPRVVAEAQMRNRVDAFFEGLATREIQSRGAA